MLRSETSSSKGAKRSDPADGFENEEIPEYIARGPQLQDWRTIDHREKESDHSLRHLSSRQSSGARGVRLQDPAYVMPYFAMDSAPQTTKNLKMHNQSLMRSSTSA
jgi:hypothetical protein